MFTTRINTQGTSQQPHIHISKHLNVFQLSKRVVIHSFTSIKCIKTLHVNIVLFLFAFIIQYYSICSTTVIINIHKHPQSKGTVSLHCAKKHSCCLKPYMTQQTHIPCSCQLTSPQSSLCSCPTLSGSQLAGLVHSLALLVPLVTSLVLQTQI